MNAVSRKPRVGSSKRRSEVTETPQPQEPAAVDARPIVETSRTPRKRRRRFVL